jgi:hypothetical protein
MAAGKRTPLGEGKKSQKRAASKKRLIVKRKKRSVQDDNKVQDNNKKKPADEKSPYFPKDFRPSGTFGCIIGYTARSKYRDDDKGGGSF